MIRGIITLLLLTLSCSVVEAVDQYKINPYTGKFDNTGSLNVVGSKAQCFTTDYCFVYSSSSQQLTLYVNDTIQMKWPQIAAVQDKILLEASFGGGTDSILIEGSATDVLLLE